MITIMMEEVSTYITENRVNNVISHIGEVKEADIGKVIGLTAKDVMEEFVKDSKTYNLLEKPEAKILSKKIATLTAPVVRQAIYKRLMEEA